MATKIAVSVLMIGTAILASAGAEVVSQPRDLSMGKMNDEGDVSGSRARALDVSEIRAAFWGNTLSVQEPDGTSFVAYIAPAGGIRAHGITPGEKAFRDTGRAAIEDGAFCFRWDAAIDLPPEICSLIYREGNRYQGRSRGDTSVLTATVHSGDHEAAK